MHVKKCIHFILYYFIVLPLLYIVNYIVFES